MGLYVIVGLPIAWVGLVLRLNPAPGIAESAADRAKAPNKLAQIRKENYSNWNPGDDWEPLRHIASFHLVSRLGGFPNLVCVVLTTPKSSERRPQVH